MIDPLDRYDRMGILFLEEGFGFLLACFFARG